MVNIGKKNPNEMQELCYAYLLDVFFLLGRRYPFVCKQQP